MKITISTSRAIRELMSDENAKWSYDGARAVIEYLEEQEEQHGQDFEFDRVAIRCEFSEYETALEAAIDYGYEPNPNLGSDEQSSEEQESDALDWLQNMTTVLQRGSAIVIATDF
jgi:phosphosulfolactate synthase (CoM biosynthesis protein A)